MITQDLGIATAYGYAKSKGYTGTEAEFAELMASYASTAQTAIEAADRAVEANTAAQSAKTDASASKTAAQTAAQTATTKASEASQSASTATTKASEASTSADTASAAATSAGTSAQTATTAATTATTKASEASESAATATTAKTDAETARDAAAQSASEAAESARTLTIDATLTQSGQAADAKVVGDEISQIQTGIVVLESGSYADTDGMHKYTNVTRIRNAYPLAVNNLKSITIPTGYQAWFYRIAANFSLISAFGSWLTGKVYIPTIATSQTQYLTFVIKNASTPSVDISDQVANVQNDMVYETILDVFGKEIKSIPQNNLSFAELVKPVNLFDYTSEDMCKPGWWYYSSSVGSVVSATQTQYSTHYVAIKVPVYDSTKITLGIYPDDSARLVYWVGAVDADMRLISYSIVNQNAPVTYNLPAGTVYFLASYSLGSNNFAKYLPRVMVVNADAITGYSAYFKPYYFLNDCKTNAEKPNEIAVMQSIIGTDENTVKLCLPDAYNLVVGDTFELFYKGIVNAVNTDMYDVVVNCSKGSAYAKKFVITPTTAENLTMTVTLYGINHNVLDTKSVTLRIHSKASSPSTTKNVLCVGDSLTTAGQWPAELHRRLTASNGTPEGDGLTNINFIGTRVTAGGVHYEGYGGWTLNSYNTENVSFNVRVITCTHDKNEAEDQHSIYKDANNVQWKLETIETGQIKIIAVSGEGREFPNTGTLTWVSGGVNHSNIVYTAQTQAAGNPFWDSTEGKVDFASYASRLGVSGIDFVYVLIGWNSASWNETDYKASAQTFIDNVHASYPDAKVTFVGLEIPARDGLGANYGATGIYSRYYDLMQFVFNLDRWYEDLADNNTNVYHINLAGQFDTEHNMLTATRQVNARNTETEVYQSNGVHPALSGQMQIADAVYRDITARL